MPDTKSDQPENADTSETPEAQSSESQSTSQSSRQASQPAAPKRTSGSSPSLPRMHMVQCVKLGRRLPGLAKPPVPGELGQRIYDNVSEQAWQMWQDHSRLLINHYGLNLADPDARALMRQQMEDFFFGPPEEKPEGWVPETGGGAKGKGAPAPAASRKK